MNIKIPPLSCGNVHAQVFTSGVEIRSRGSWLEPTEVIALQEWLNQVVGNTDKVNAERYLYIKKHYDCVDEIVDAAINREKTQ